MSDDDAGPAIREPDPTLHEALDRAHEARLSGDFEVAASALDDAAARAAELDDADIGSLSVALDRATLYIEFGMLGDAAAALKWAWEHPTAQTNQLMLADIQLSFGRIGLAAGSEAAAAECFEAARAIYESLGSPPDVVRADGYLAQAHGGRKDLQPD